MTAPLIVSASYRTDIPAFYGRWFAERLKAGGVLVRNPYGNKPYRVSLAPEDVLGFVFWSRNFRPFLDNLAAVDRQGTPFVLQMTITGYPRLLETSTIAMDEAVAQVEHLVAAYGPGRVVWRYDPIVFSSVTGPQDHLARFAALAQALAGMVDECVVSFATAYAKTKRRLDGLVAAGADGFDWRDPPADEKQALLIRLRDIGADHGIRLTLCAQPDLLVEGVAGARCIDADRLSAVAGHPVQAPERGNRPGCLCAQSRDIGAYDTCPHGCVYCYAVRDAKKAKRAYADHDPSDPMLGASAPITIGLGNTGRRVPGGA